MYKMNCGKNVVALEVLILVWSCYFLGICSSARILALFPMPAKSHNIVYQALATELASRGHEVVTVSNCPQKKPLQNYKDINIGFVENSLTPEVIGDIFTEDRTAIRELLTLWNIGNIICDAELKSPELQQLINSDEHFDAILMELFFNECFYGFAHKFQAPVITISAMGAFRWGSESVANPEMFSHVPNFLLPLSDTMSFFERFINTVFSLFDMAGRSLFYMPMQDSIARRYFGESMPPLSDLVRNTSLVLVNSHFSILFPRPYVPNMREVGGMHIRPSKPLPQDLKSFCDSAKHGVIYFSLGSNLRNDQLPKAKIQMFLEVFSTLKQSVLMKWESDDFPGKPDNVKTGKWLPQQDILAHPNVKLFISHGGLLSTEEAVYHGVPTLGIPFYGDQELNLKRSINLGFAEMLQIKNITKEKLHNAVNRMLGDKRYEENVNKLSKIYKDQPHTPLEEAVFWTEYVIRHRGAPHMQSAAMHLAWYQYFLLDVIAVLILLSGITVATPILVIRLLCGICRKKTVSTSGVKGTKRKNTSKKQR